MTEQQKDAIAAAREMTGALNGLSERLGAAEEYGKRNRLMAWLAGAAAVIALGLAVAVAILYVQVSGNAATLSDLHSSSVTSCRSGNVTRANEIALWAHLISVSEAQPPPPHESAAQRKHSEELLAQFLAYVHRTFASRNCTQLYKLGG